MPGRVRFVGKSMKSKMERSEEIASLVVDKRETVQKVHGHV